MQELNLHIPTCWQELSQTQLRYLFFLLSSGYNADQVRTYALFRFAQVDVNTQQPGLYLVSIDKQQYRLTPLQVAEVLPALDWTLNLPVYPVRLNVIQDRYEALYDARFSTLTFENYQILENLYQGYLHTQDASLLISMANILYSPQVISLSPEEETSVYYWWGSFKLHLSNRFTHLFKSSPVRTDEKEDLSSVSLRLQIQMDTQLRALTGGDITKNATVLAMDVWSALTELDAKAEDAEEIAKLTKK